MNKIMIFLLLLLFSCGEKTQETEIKQMKSALQILQSREILEGDTKAGIEEYINDLNSSDWRSRLEKRKPGDKQHQAFIDSYQKYRDAYQNMKMKIKHLAIDGEEAIMWAEVSCTHDGITNDVIANIQPKGATVNWQEVWYFDMKNRQFGDKWDIVVRGLDKMKSVGANCVPDTYFEN
jgi:predicted ester cyclase